MRLNAASEIVFVLDTTEVDPATVGEVYPDPSSVLLANFSTMNGAMVEDDFYTDQWGTWLSGYSPIYRSNGEREAVLAIDVSAEAVIARERQLLWIVSLIATAVTATATGLGWRWAHSISQPLLQMVTMAASIANGDLTTLAQDMDSVAHGNLNQTFTILTSPLDIVETNEVGTLGRSFNQMLTRLQEISYSFAQMITRLSESIGQIAENSENLRAASEQLSSAAAQAAKPLAGSPPPSSRWRGEPLNNLSRSTALPPPSNR